MSEAAIDAVPLRAGGYEGNTPNEMLSAGNASADFFRGLLQKGSECSTR
jgi:hypothetical protein